MKVLSERKLIKKKIYRLNKLKADYPRLMDCSEVYGDGCFDKEGLAMVESEISKLRAQLQK